MRSTVIPIPKPGKPLNTLQNLRPISLTSNLCEILEKMVQTRLSWILETRGDLHRMQTGFRPGLSTQDSLEMIHQDVYEKPQFKRQLRTIVALDIKKTFDSIPHKAVIESAQRREIRGNMLNLIKSFLKERTYEIVIGGNRSPWRHNNTGVPLGAVISPTLFNMAMTDLANALDAIPNINFSIERTPLHSGPSKGLPEIKKQQCKKPWM
ncbi:hypothetical protein HPB47_017032 [Ixodes persulcatus]|uniref:Uncharacterized protein n=1 Tax=Ixodes persulcatus TaxID=34615 RepID=A0AC60R2E7_IXOPE|nr:hypothetical protein HPB47_017032 [Ixodes persulcatus]